MIDLIVKPLSEPPAGQDLFLLCERFHGLPTYEQRLVFFHDHFGIFPIRLPDFDLDLGWYHSSFKMMQFTAILNSETIYKDQLVDRKFSVGGRSFRFNVKPDNALQRGLYNQFLISFFLEDLPKLISRFQAAEPEASAGPSLAGRVKHLELVQAWIQLTVADSNASDMRHKFLTIFHKGMKAFNSPDDSMLRVKRRMIELLLYSHGLMFAMHLDELRKEFGRSGSVRQNGKLDLPLALVLLQKLGFVELLKKQGYSLTEMAQLISLINSGCCFDYALAIPYLSALGTGESTDLMNEANVQEIENAFKNLGIKYG